MSQQSVELGGGVRAAPAWRKALAGVAAALTRGPIVGRIGLSIVALACFLAVFGPWIIPHDIMTQDYMRMNEPPTWTYWLGTDDFGRDVFSRLIYGCRVSLIVGLAGAIVAAAIGVGLALFALALGGVVEYAVFGFIDLVRAMPGILFALAMVVAMEPGTASVVVALGISFSPVFARITRATFRREISRDYVAAATAFGAGRLRVVFRHVMPNILGAIITQFAIIMPRCMVTESVLSFLGLGVSPDTPTWGRMIANAAVFIEEAPHAVLAPVLALALVTFGLSMVGDSLRRRFDPLRNRMETS